MPSHRALQDVSIGLKEKRKIKSMLYSQIEMEMAPPKVAPS